MVSFFHDLLFTYTYFCGWRDAVEILAFSTIIYYFSLWLRTDRQKNLLGYFYAYCLVVCGAYQLQLAGIIFLCAITSPIVLMLFILAHQHTLQKNFIALGNIVPAHKESHDWLESLIRSCLVALNNNQEIRCIIEHKDSLQEHLYTPLELQTQVHQDLLAILFASSSYHQDQLLWVTSKGKLIGLNARWSAPAYVHETTTDAAQIWKQEALFFTTKTDAIIFQLTPATRSFTLFVNGKEYPAINTANALTFIKKYLTTSTAHQYQGGRNYEQSSQHQTQRNT
jgi:hypothetical protein